MNKQVYDYFEDLDKKKLPRKKHHLIYDGERIINNETIDKNGNPKDNATIDGVHYFTKGNNFEYSIIDIASSNMYNNIGIMTPPPYIITKNPEGLHSFATAQIATQDVHTIKGMLFTIADQLLSKADILALRVGSTYKWDPLYDGHIQRIFLKYMTKECFDKLIGLFLVDELRSEQDRHENNYFFYKTTDADKFEGVMPIDNEYANILLNNVRSKRDFNAFLYTPYHTPTILTRMDNRCYQDRIKDIKELLNDQILSQEQIELLKRAIQYDFPREIKKVSKQLYNSDQILTIRDFAKRNKSSAAQQAYDSISRLWDYHHKDLGKELGL